DSVVRKLGIKVRPRSSQLIPKIRDRMLTMYKDGFSGAEIAAKFECSLETVASVIELATRKSQIIQRITATLNPTATVKPNENHEPPLETPPQIPLETLVRNFWADKARAIDVLLLPPELRLKITENVEQALAYAWTTIAPRPR
ncbi:MAG: hypothetical protein FWD31_13470, partial [Planctomycetaceae bacterium]|nr:hypothetical protein [Planctomycetaceae bacterium]